MAQKKGTTTETISRTYSAGTYYIRVYGNKNAASASCYNLTITTGTATRIPALEGSPNEINLGLFPNPANQILHIYTSGPMQEKWIEVLDLNGKMLIKEKTRKNNTALAVDRLPAGLYFLKITARDGTILSGRKFMKQ